MQSTPWGVWATPDSEIVLTPKVLLVYRRSSDLLCAYAYERRESDYGLLALSASYWGRDWCAASLDHDGRPSIKGHRDGALRLLRAVPRSVSVGPTNLPSFPWPGESVQPVLVEPIRISGPFPGPQASLDNVGRCLSVWPMGTILVRESGRPTSFSLLVNTLTHMVHLRELGP